GRAADGQTCRACLKACRGWRRTYRFGGCWRVASRLIRFPHIRLYPFVSLAQKCSRRTVGAPTLRRALFPRYYAATALVSRPIHNLFHRFCTYFNTSRKLFPGSVHFLPCLILFLPPHQSVTQPEALQ